MFTTAGKAGQLSQRESEQGGGEAAARGRPGAQQERQGEEPRLNSGGRAGGRKPVKSRGRRRRGDDRNLESSSCRGRGSSWFGDEGQLREGSR